MARETGLPTSIGTDWTIKPLLRVEHLQLHGGSRALRSSGEDVRSVEGYEVVKGLSERTAGLEVTGTTPGLRNCPPCGPLAESL